MIDSTAPSDESRGTEVPRSLETRSCEPPTQKERLPHSRWGILSFRLATWSLLIWFVVTIIPFCLLCYGETTTFSHKSLEMLFFTVVFFASVGCVLAMITAFVFSILGLRQPHTRKNYAVWGLSFSILVLVMFLVIASIFIAIVGSWMVHGF